MSVPVNPSPIVTVEPTFSSPDLSYYKVLTQIARNIRRTLDPDTIRQETVKGLVEGLNASRCVICSYKKGSEKPVDQVPIVAAYSQGGFSSLLGKTIRLADHPELLQALEHCQPILVVNKPDNRFQAKSVLVMTTCYQDEPNGLIYVHQCDRHRDWSETEIELVREIADQVGTAIAHATLYQELEETREQAEEASRLKSEFLAGTSHELRTPLNGIIGFLKLILEGMVDDPEEQQEFIEEAHRSALHLLNLINDILDIAKIEAGKMELELGSVHLNELFDDVEKFTRTQAQAKKLSFCLQVPPTRDPIVLYGNYQRLLQVLLNLIGNAIKFTHEGGVTISAEVVKKKVKFDQQEFPGYVKVQVADTGIGVSLEKQDRLFKSFSQVDGERTRRYGGTGLGLAISQRLVETMGGDVRFYSMGEGLGSTVTFTIPLYQEPVLINATEVSNPLERLIEAQKGAGA